MRHHGCVVRSSGSGRSTRVVRRSTRPTGPPSAHLLRNWTKPRPNDPGFRLVVQELAEMRGVGHVLTTYDMPIEGRDEWIAAAERLASRTGTSRGALSRPGDSSPTEVPRGIRRGRRIRPRRCRALGYSATHREAPPRRPAGAVGSDDRAADLHRTRG